MRTINRSFFAAAIISLVPLVMVPFARYHLPDLFAQLGLAGDAIVVVPPGGRVTGGGLSVFGDRRIEVTLGDGPEIRIDGYSLFGDVKISDRPPA